MDNIKLSKLAHRQSLISRPAGDPQETQPNSSLKYKTSFSPSFNRCLKMYGILKRCVVRAVWWVGLPWAPKRRPPPSVERPHSDLRSRTGDSQAETPEFEPHNTGTQNLIQNLNQDLVHIHKHRMRIECNDFSLLFPLLISFRNSQSLLKFFWTLSYWQLID